MPRYKTVLIIGFIRWNDVSANERSLHVNFVNFSNAFNLPKRKSRIKIHRFEPVAENFKKGSHNC